MKKRLISMIAAITIAAGLFTSCGSQPGKVYALQDFEGSAGEGILAPAVDSQGRLVVAAQEEGSPVVLTTYDASGKKASAITTDVTGPAAKLALDGKDTAYILTDTDVHVLDASGKTTAKIPVGNLMTQTGTMLTGTEALPAKSAQASGSDPQKQASQSAAPKLSAFSVIGFAASSDGGIFLSILGSGVVQLDKTGKQVRSLGAAGMNLICMNEKEQLVVFGTGPDGYNLTTYDTQNGTRVSKLDTAFSNPNLLFYDKQGKRVLFMNADGVYPVKEDGSAGDALITLTNFSLGSATHGFAGFAMDGEGAVYIASTEDKSGIGFGVSMKAGSSGNATAISFPGSKADHISRLALVDVSAVPEKKTLTVAGLTENGAVRAAIDAFQKAHPEYLVNLKTYGNQIAGLKPASGNTSRDTGLTSLIQKFNTDIISGNTADIYILDNLPYYKYINKGILADLGEMMDADNMDLSQYYSNIFDACRVDGKLYTLPTGFSYNMLVGKTANMPASETPSVEDFFRAVDSLPAGVAALPKDDPTKVFTDFMRNDYSYFVDQAARKAKFNSSEFLNLLERFKTMIDSKTSSKGEEEQAPYEQVGDGVLAFTNVSIHGMQEMQAVQAFVGDDAKFTNMPSVDPASYDFQAQGIYGINASSPNKQMAWEFLKTVLSPEILGNMQQANSIPVSKAAVQNMINQLTDPNKTMRMMVKTNTKQFEIKPLSAEEYAAMAETFGKLNKITAPDQNIVNILSEELPSFFSGQKNAGDVAALIQNRVQTILDE